MKYQALKRLKTKTKLLKMCDTLQEAHDIITKDHNANFIEFSYIGGFPVYRNDKNVFSIQGACMLNNGGHIVCGIDEQELSNFNFN